MDLCYPCIYKEHSYAAYMLPKNVPVRVYINLYESYPNSTCAQVVDGEIKGAVYGPGDSGTKLGLSVAPLSKKDLIYDQNWLLIIQTPFDFPRQKYWMRLGSRRFYHHDFVVDYTKKHFEPHRIKGVCLADWLDKGHFIRPEMWQSQRKGAMLIEMENWMYNVPDRMINRMINRTIIDIVISLYKIIDNVYLLVEIIELYYSDFWKYHQMVNKVEAIIESIRKIT